MFINIDAALCVTEKEFRVGESEHAEGSLTLESSGYGCYVLIFGIWNTHWNLLIKGQEFEAFLSGDSNVGLEEVNCETFSRDIKLVKFPEEFSIAAEAFTE